MTRNDYLLVVRLGHSYELVTRPLPRSLDRRSRWQPQPAGLYRDHAEFTSNALVDWPQCRRHAESIAK